MHVGLDARTVFAERRRGTGKNLIDLYRTLAAAKPDWRFTLFRQTEGLDDPFTDLPNVRAVSIDIAGDRFNMWQDVRLPVAAWVDKIDVLHCPANTAPLVTATATVLTVHDLIPIEIAPGTEATERWLRRVRRSARRARHIITPSLYSRNAIVEHLGVEAERITVNYWAPDQGCRPPTSDEVARLRTRMQIPADAPYILAFGAEDPRKNTARVIEAWGRLDPAIRAGARLVVVGLQADALATMRTVTAAHVTDDSCQLHGFVSETDVATLLGGAVALCYPSLSEGFGLPIVDAFACGTAVLTSRTTSLPEVAGDAAVLVNPESASEIAEGLALLLSSAERREELRRRGRERLGLFSWARCAEVAARVLQQAAGPAARRAHA